MTIIPSTETTVKYKPKYSTEYQYLTKACSRLAQTAININHLILTLHINEENPHTLKTNHLKH